MPIFESRQRLHATRRRSGRRRFLYVVAAGVGGYFAYRWWREQPRRLVQRRHRYLTPNRDFYTVSIGSYPPKPDLDIWRLKLEGPSGSRRLDYEQLTELPSKVLPKTFMCISNSVGGDAIGNAEWTVTPLEPLLRPMIPDRGKQWRVGFYALDGFYSSVPSAVALDPEAYLAYRMNGAPLPREHGFPLRVLLPGKYGMKQPRWLERIEVTGESISGYWERRGWSAAADVKTTSRVDRSKALPDGSWRLQGVAYCGALPVEKVEVRIDQEPWRRARLTSPARPNAWSTWELDWRPHRPGNHVVEVRAEDADGRLQVETFSGAFPSGATGVHRVIIKV